MMHDDKICSPTVAANAVTCESFGGDSLVFDRFSVRPRHFSVVVQIFFRRSRDFKLDFTRPRNRRLAQARDT
jgi:hypothetical protein